MIALTILLVCVVLVIGLFIYLKHINRLHWLSYVFNIPRSFYFCMHYFPFATAVKIPIFVSDKVWIKNLKGNLIIDAPGVYFGMIKLGFGEVEILDRKKERSIFDCKGTIIFRGYTGIGHGFRISVNSSGVLEFGENFCMTAGSTIICHDNIVFGKDNLMSWECLIMDTDYHKIFQDGELINSNKQIKIGNHVWMGARVIVLKGICIPDNCVIAAGSNVVKTYNEEACVIAGNPAKVVKNNIVWKP